MNIFGVHEDPRKAATALCNTHVNKMFIETAQILCTTARYMEYDPPYQSTHGGHPVHRWVRRSKDNWDWLCAHGKQLMVLYGCIYPRSHKAVRGLMWACHLDPETRRFDYEPSGRISAFIPSVYPRYHGAQPELGESIEMYRRYYSLKERMWWEQARLRCMQQYVMGNKARKGWKPLMVWSGPNIRDDFMGPELGDHAPGDGLLEAAMKWFVDNGSREFDPQKPPPFVEVGLAEVAALQLTLEDVPRRYPDGVPEWT